MLSLYGRNFLPKKCISYEEFFDTKRTFYLWASWPQRFKLNVGQQIVWLNWCQDLKMFNDIRNNLLCSLSFFDHLLQWSLLIYARQFSYQFYDSTSLYWNKFFPSVTLVLVQGRAIFLYTLLRSSSSLRFPRFLERGSYFSHLKLHFSNDLKSTGFEPNLGRLGITCITSRSWRPLHSSLLLVCSQLYYKFNNVL